MLRLWLILIYLTISFASPAQPAYEFRGVWMATVENIDWPLRGQTSPAAQRAAFTAQLDLHQRNGMNAVIVQVRPAADAFYPSQHEPWSRYLTGAQGRPPAPWWDPLEWMLTETHKRGFEFHAWVNPFRASMGSAPLSPTHISRVQPGWMLRYGANTYFDPGNRAAQDWVVAVVRDLVARYDIDAVHMDDYFYPYPLAGKPFPDNKTYGQWGGGLSRPAWRRSNVDSVVSKLAMAIKAEKPWVKFGISPFGVWRSSRVDPEGSATGVTLSNYDDLYADVTLWLRKGWIDYVAPQLYWEIGHRSAPYEVLIDWWARHAYGRHVYIGHGIYLGTERKTTGWKQPSQLGRQLSLTRATAGIHGSAFYSSNTFFKNPFNWNDTLRRNYYRLPAKVPPMEWLAARP